MNPDSSCFMKEFSEIKWLPSILLLLFEVVPNLTTYRGSWQCVFAGAFLKVSNGAKIQMKQQEFSLNDSQVDRVVRPLL